MRRNSNAPKDEPGRPSHFREDKNVSVPRDNTDPDYGTGEETVPQLGFIPAPEPAPVYLVEAPPAATNVREWSAGTYLLTTVPTQIIGGNPSRTRLVVRNHDAANSALLIRKQMDMATVNGFEIPAGQSEEMTHNSAVWARSNTGTCEVSVFAEYTLKDE